jgi:hypothetical protein
VIAVLSKRATSKARDKAKAKADTKYKAALAKGLRNEQATLRMQSKAPTNPKIDINEKGITLSVGTSKISITEDGIDIVTAFGGEVNVNGQKFKRTVPALEVGE